MNYYHHHIGDYDSHTAHLSWLEDCAYRRLLCLYYRTEKPLVTDPAAICRLIRASDKKERAAVETVLREFFIQKPDGWHHGRCQEEIEAAVAKREAARNNGTKGGRPRNRTDNPDGTQAKPTGLFLGNPDGTQAKALQSQSQSQSQIQERIPPDGGPPIDPPEPPPDDPRRQIFELGKTILGRNSGGLISAAIARTSEAKVGQVLGEMALKATADPRAYFSAATAPQERRVVV